MIWFLFLVGMIWFGCWICLIELFVVWKVFGFFKDVQVYVVVYIVFGCFYQRLVVLWEIGIIVQCFIDDLVLCLIFVYFGVIGLQILVCVCYGVQMFQWFGGGWVGGVVYLFGWVVCKVEQYFGIGGVGDVFLVFIVQVDQWCD